MREKLLKKQPTWGLRRAQGTGQKSATPATLTKVILVLLTMFLLPSAAWGGNYNSGTLDTNNNTWGVWKLSDAAYSSPQYDYLSFSGAGTITLTLTRPDNTLELIKSIRLEIGGTETSSTTTLKSAMIGTTDITSDFVITDNSSLTYTFQPTVPIEWSGDIVITLQGTNNSGSILGAYVQTVTGYGLSVAGVPVTDDNNTNILGDQNSTVSFTPAGQDIPATLTLKDATINGGIVWSQTSDLVIDLTGTNTITPPSTNESDAITTAENLSEKPNLSFTGSGSLAITNDNCFPISKFNTVSLANGLYLKSDNVPGVYWDDSSSWFSSTTGNTPTSLTITSGVYYPIWVISSDGVSYTQVSGTNKEDVFNDDTPKVSYDSDNNQLTLYNWECATTGGEFAIILGDQESFNIHLWGVNKIGGSGISFAKEDASLALSTDDEHQGSLTIVQNQDNSYLFTSIPDDNITYSKLTRTDNAVTYQAPPITVAGVSPDSEGKFSGISGVTFTPATIGVDQSSSTPATLTLNNANFGPSLTGIVWSGNGNLKIQYSGNNIINTRNGNELNAGSKDGYCIFGNGSSDLILSASDQASTLTLKPSYGGSTESNSSRAAISGFENVTLDSGWGMYYTDDYLAATATSLTAGKEVVICKGQPYGISVGGVPVTSANINDVLNDGGTVKFKLATLSPDGGQTPDTPATLTLDGATISGNIESNITPLTVYLKGSSTITPSNTSNAPFQYTGTESSATLTFESSEADKGSLTMNGISSIDYISGGYTIDGKNDWAHSGNYTDPDWIKEEYSTPGNKVVIWRNTQYDLQVGSYHVAESNKNQLEAFSFDSDTYTLSPISSSFDGNIISGLSKLTIEVPGKYTITGTISAKEGTDSKLEIKAGDTDMVHSLTVKNENGAIVGFSDVIITSPMKLVTPATDQPTWNVSTTEVVISDEVFYDLWIGGVQVTSGNASDILGVAQSSQSSQPTAVFNAETSTLTLNGATIEASEGSGIESELSELNVNIVGYGNTINIAGSEDAAFKGTGTNAIAFTFDGSSSSLYIESINPISGLIATFEDGYGLTSVSPGAHYLEHLVSPYFSSASSENGITVTLNKPQSNTDEESKYKDATIYYSITYANEADNVEDAEYTTSFSMTKPGTVTAYLTLEEERGQSEDVIGKYYGYPDAPYTIGAGNDVSPDIYPNIVDGEYIGFYDGGYSSNNETIATFAAGKITAKEPGTTTLTATLSGSDMAFTVLNPYDPTNSSHYPITFSVIVGENLDNLFAANQDFGTWYNTSDKTYKVPDGITAYIITGVDGDKVTIAETKVIPPNAPILMEKGENAKAFTYTEATDTDGSFPSGNILNYTTTDKEAVEASKLYVLYNGQFVKVTAGTKILANHCYLDLGGTSAGTRGFYNIGDGEGTTAIREVKTDGVNNEKWTDGEWYTLQGQRVTKPAKGLYILNGKKVVVK